MSVTTPEAQPDVAQRLPYPHAVKRFPRLRQTLLSTFSNCGLSAKFASDHEEGWSTHPQGRGQIGHRALAKAFEEMAAQGERKIPTELMTAIFHETLRQHDVDLECPRCIGEDIQSDDGWMTCNECGHGWWTEIVALPDYQIAELRMGLIKWAHENEWSIENLAAVEERLDTIIAYPSDQGAVERVLTGRPDAMLIRGAQAVVLDWKFSWAVPKPSSVSQDGFFQQRLYGYLVLRNYKGVNRVTLREFYVYKSQVREASIHRDDMPNIEAELSALVERFDRTVEKKLWRPAPGAHCGNCPRPSSCPIFPEARRAGEIADADDAKRVAAELIVAEQAVKRRREALRAYTMVHGPVPIADAKGRRVYGYKEATRRKRPTAAEVKKGLAAGQRVESLYREETYSKFTDHAPEAEVSPEDARMAEQLRASVDQAREKREKQTKRKEVKHGTGNNR